MTLDTILPLLVILFPLASFAASRTGLKYLDGAVALVNVLLVGILHFLIPISGFFYIDNTAWVFLIMVTSVYALSLVYSKKYFENSTIGIGEGLFYLLMALFTVTMLFSLEVNNLGLMWVGIEATTISSALLLMADKNEISVEATWRYIVIVSAGVTFAFISIILIYYSLGTLNISTLLSRNISASLTLNVASAIALIGFGTKVGVFPVHTWLPDAHSEAPSPISAMFSGVLLPTALYVLYRIYEIDPLRDLYIWVGVISVIAASLFLGYQTRYKRMFAYSTMENMNLALIGMAAGGIYGLTGALVLLLAHSFGKAGAFYSSGSILRGTGSRKISEIGGLWKSMPRSSGAFILSSFAVTGTPPFGTFFGEFFILLELLLLHLYVPFFLVAFFVMAAFISVNYNVTRMVFRGETEAIKPDFREDRLMSAIGLFSAIASLAIGVIYGVIFLAAL